MTRTHVDGDVSSSQELSKDWKPIMGLPDDDSNNVNHSYKPFYFHTILPRTQYVRHMPYRQDAHSCHTLLCQV